MHGVTHSSVQGIMHGPMIWGGRSTNKTYVSLVSLLAATWAPVSATTNRETGITADLTVSGEDEASQGRAS